MQAPLAVVVDVKAIDLETTKLLIQAIESKLKKEPVFGPHERRLIDAGRVLIAEQWEQRMRTLLVAQSDKSP